MNILITGGSGYVGNHLNTFYKNKANVTCLSRGVLDISDTYSVNKWFEGKYFDVVLHAAISGGNRVDADTIKEYKNNIKMIDNLYEHKNKFGKLISFGSGAERTGTWYGRSKEYIHRLILNTNNWYNLRIYGIFDKDENDYRFIKANILRYLRKEPMQIHKNKYMDFIHIDDFLKIVHHVIDNATDKVIDCVYKEKYTLSEIAQYINTLDEYSVEILTKELDADYVGICTLDLPYIGLLESIKRVYNEIKFSNW